LEARLGVRAFLATGFGPEEDRDHTQPGAAIHVTKLRGTTTVVRRPNACRRYAGRMTCPDQFIFGDAKEIATFVKQQRWHESERASWRTPEGTIVRYLHRLDQLRSITRGSTLHVVGFYDIDQMRRDLSHLHVVLYPNDWA
jgi:hypothetical protein